MAPVHLHLLLNHVPSVGVVFALALLVYGRIRRSEEVALAALVTFAVVGVLSAAVYFSGQNAEEAVARLAGVSDDLVEVHEAVAVYATLSAGALGMLALAELVLLRMGDAPDWFKSVTFGAALGVAGLLLWTSYLGGLIRHPEIEASTATQEAPVQLPVDPPDRPSQSLSDHLPGGTP